MEPLISTYMPIIKEYFEYVNKKDSGYKNKCCIYNKYWIKEKTEYIKNVNATNIFNSFNNYINTPIAIPNVEGCKLDIREDDDNKYEKIGKLYNIYYNYRTKLLLIEMNEPKTATYHNKKSLFYIYNELNKTDLSPRIMICLQNYIK
ncbi:hypothetical protein PGO_004390 [Plasmodium gonderi]|uniref:Variable surface protein n=1 Tax=Plasmodium gonderi TaxID=77519 RepID=A0A1Y1JY42_PLAGO|nr:hypothetical protein PGO_004390 [Plasmodium gonderi]GAW84684.1 hypothetical protein PGO_004390 [Plasmodium gonderi]